MINTIFYFVDTEQEYQAKRNSGEIKPYTIVFVRDTRTIWKNGIRYSGFTEDEIKQIIELETEDINAAIELINHTIEEINQQVSDEKDRLDDVVDGLDSEIQDKVEDLFADSQWIQNNQPQGLVVPYDMSWDNNIQAYLQRVGLWDYNDASIVTKWSTIRQSLNSIQSDVNSITETGGALDLLQSQITQEVTDRGDAITNLGNTYARITDVDGVKDVIEWMYSGLKSGSGADKTYAEIVAAGKNGLSSAISDLRTSVDSLGSTYVAQSSLTSSVDSAISGIINAASGTYANTSMFSKIDTNSDDIAAIATKVTGDTSQSTVAAKLNGMTASLVTTANLDSAMAGLSAQAKDTVGNAIAATIFAKANEQGSTITLDADQINLQGQTNFDNLIGGKVDAHLANANIITQSTLGGEVQTILEDGNATFVGDVTANSLTAGNRNGMYITTDENQFVVIDSNDKIQAGIKGGGDIRYWAGGDITYNNAQPTDSQLTAAPFRVDKTGKLYCTDVDIQGKVIGTDGNIGGFNIGDKILSNTAYDASIIVQDAATNPSQVARIGKEAVDTMTNKSCSMQAESKSSGTFNTALYLNAEGGTYNYAFHGNGNGVLNGLMFGYKTQFKTIPSGSNDTLSYLYLKDGATTIITGSHTSGHVVLAVPDVDDVRKCLGLSVNDTTTPFAIELTFINLSQYAEVHLGFRGNTLGGTLDSKYPWLMNQDNQLWASSLQIAKGDLIKMLFVYAPSSSGIGNYEYRAQLIARQADV